ncbi:MAG: esterase-like activity of phytase family protein [Pseudomonadota bacterium]
MLRMIPLALAGLLAAASAEAAEPVPARLVGHALLPAGTLLDPPPEAPPFVREAGRFLGPNGTRPVEPLVRNGVALPLAGQPLQGLSSLVALGDGRFLALADNGFGSKTNSPDALLAVHVLAVDWSAGVIRHEDSIHLADPLGRFPHRLVLEAGATRFLTGSDFDPESLEVVGDHWWIGDEFGPFLLGFDTEGRLRDVVEAHVAGEPVRSPDHPALTLPARPQAVAFEVRRSRGFEGLALHPDGRLIAALEGPLMADDGAIPFARLLAFDPAAGAFTGEEWRYPLAEPDHVLGALHVLDERRALVIERDWGAGDAELACVGEARTGCHPRPAAFKRVYRIDLGEIDRQGFVEKEAFVDLLDIADPDGVARTGTTDGTFTFPFVTIESVAIDEAGYLVLVNDDNFPSSTGRVPGVPEGIEMIRLDAPALVTVSVDRG